MVEFLRSWIGERSGLGLLGLAIFIVFVVAEWIADMREDPLLFLEEESSMREILTHKVNECNDGIKILVLDEPGIGGGNHHYRLEFDDPKWGPDPQSMHQVQEIYFQNGPIKEVGTNGLTHEVLLAIVIDRLQGFQRGQYACAENQTALDAVLAAQESLLNRTRGVEGTHEK